MQRAGASSKDYCDQPGPLLPPRSSSRPPAVTVTGVIVIAVIVAATILVIALPDAHGGCTIDQPHGDLAVVCARFELCLDFVAVPALVLGAKTRCWSHRDDRESSRRPRDVYLAADCTERRSVRCGTHAGGLRRGGSRRGGSRCRCGSRAALSSDDRLVVGAVDRVVLVSSLTTVVTTIDWRVEVGELSSGALDDDGTVSIPGL